MSDEHYVRTQLFSHIDEATDNASAAVTRAASRPTFQSASHDTGEANSRSVPS